MMTSDRRTFIKNMGRGMAVTGLAATGLARCTSPSDAGSETLFVTDRNHPEPAAMGYDRLPLAWYQQTVQRLKDKLPGVDAILLESDKNKVYFTGCFRGSEERTTWVFFPTHEHDTAYWYGPGIDRDLITSWWSTDYAYYFCYRNYLLAPWTDEQDKMWQVVADSVAIMVEVCKPGVACSEVAYQVHQYQVHNGMQDYIYHRPGHGAGQPIEGHQPPFLSLGNHTPIEAGMMFSVEPGLYDERKGFGINPSDHLLITQEGAVLMSRIPFSKQWSYLTL